MIPFRRIVIPRMSVETPWLSLQFIGVTRLAQVSVTSVWYLASKNDVVFGETLVLAGNCGRVVGN